jgi:hypothetical protein
MAFIGVKIKWKSIAIFLPEKPVITFELAFDDKHMARDLKFKIVSKEFAGKPKTRDKLSDSEFDQTIKTLEEYIFYISDLIKFYLIKRVEIVGIVKKLNNSNKIGLAFNKEPDSLYRKAS